MNTPTTLSSRDVIEVPAALADLTGRAVTPTDPDYDTASQAWNLAVHQRPDLVVQVANATDVGMVLRYAAANGLRVAPQGTGHNAAPLGDLTGVVLLRTDRLREVSVDPAGRVVRVGAGVLWGEVTAAIAPHGLTALAGSSPDVGVIGYTLGGGYSWLGRKYGLAASWVTAVELVTADGTFHRVDADTESELFWAVRGGGANIGVVTALEFAVQQLDRVYAGSLFFPLERAGDVLKAYADWTGSVDDAATTCARLLRIPPLPDIPEPLRGNAFAVVDGAIDAPAEQAAEMLAPLRALGPVMDTFQEMPTSALGMIHMDPPNPVPGVGDGMILDEMTDRTIDALLAIAGPGVDTAFLAVDLRHLGGAMGRRDPHGGAVDYLPGSFLAYVVGMAMDPTSAERLNRERVAVREALTPWMSERDYSNFRELPTTADRTFTPDAATRLRKVVDRVDPDRMLKANHSLR